jgi:hypothetical protein
MSSKTVNGVLFIIAGLAPLLIYLGLGPDGTGILDVNLTEKLAIWFTLSTPIALMMTVDAMKGGSGHGYAKAGFVIVVIG